MKQECCGDDIGSIFFKQFDPNNDYLDCELFTQMKNDLTKLCQSENCNCQSDAERFFDRYDNIDKYLRCHLADDMKDELLKMCSNFDDYIEVLKLSNN